MTTYFTDFSGETNGALENSTHWTAVSLSLWTWIVQTDGGAPSGKSVLVDDNTEGDGWNAQTNDDIAANAGSVECVASFVFGTGITGGDTPIGPVLVSTVDQEDGYFVAWQGTSNWQVQRLDNSNVGSGVGSSASLFTPVASDVIWVRLTRNGTTIKANVWKGLASDEPAGYNLSGGTDSTYGSVKVGMGAQKAAYTPKFYAFGSSDTGVDKSAPTSAAPTSGSLAARRFGLSRAFNSAEIGRASGNVFRKCAGGLLVPAWSS